MTKRLKTWKQYIWAPVEPVYPFFRWLTIRLRLVTVPADRQHFHLGFLKEGVTYADFKVQLINNDFKHQWMAFVDPGEEFGMRKLCPVDYRYQYHVRVFKDGEVRGHYEKTPEDYPLDHLNEVDFQNRQDDFYAMFGELIERRG